MKQAIIIAALLTTAFLSAGKKRPATNGQLIYNTGRNTEGTLLLNKKASQIKLVHSCKTCHGPHGDRINKLSIQFSYLSDPANFIVPYTDSLFYRFLDHDVKSDGTKANIGVIWQMNDRDKRDLLDYLKTL